MEDAKRLEFIKNTFDTVCEQYGRGPLRFFESAAQHLGEIVALQGGEQILDVAAGTGLASVQLAQRVPDGKVTAVDLSQGMLDIGRNRAMSLGLRNTEFVQANMCDLPYPNSSFDLINSSFGMFFVEHMQVLGQHLCDKLKPGGRLISTQFAEGSMEPMSSMIAEKLREYDVEVPVLSWTRLQTESLVETLYQEVGISDVRCIRKQVGYYLSDPLDWWYVVWWAGYRGFVEQIAPDKIEEFKQAHLQDISKLVTDSGIWFNVEIIISVGTVEI